MVEVDPTPSPWSIVQTNTHTHNNDTHTSLALFSYTNKQGKLHISPALFPSTYLPVTVALTVTDRRNDATLPPKTTKSGISTATAYPEP